MVTKADRIAVEQLKQQDRIIIKCGDFQFQVKDKIAIHSIALSVSRYLDREENKYKPHKNRSNEQKNKGKSQKLSSATH